MAGEADSSNSGSLKAVPGLVPNHLLLAEMADNTVQSSSRPLTAGSGAYSDLLVPRERTE